MDTSTPYGEGDPENPDTPPTHTAPTARSVNEAMVEAAKADRTPEAEAEPEAEPDAEPEE